MKLLAVTLVNKNQIMSTNSNNFKQISKTFLWDKLSSDTFECTNLYDCSGLQTELLVKAFIKKELFNHELSHEYKSDGNAIKYALVSKTLFTFNVCRIFFVSKKPFMLWLNSLKKAISWNTKTVVLWNIIKIKF